VRPIGNAATAFPYVTVRPGLTTITARRPVWCGTTPRVRARHVKRRTTKFTMTRPKARSRGASGDAAFESVMFTARACRPKL
jgi:hypothetical protein